MKGKIFIIRQKVINVSPKNTTSKEAIVAKTAAGIVPTVMTKKQEGLKNKKLIGTIFEPLKNTTTSYNSD